MDDGRDVGFARLLGRRHAAGEHDRRGHPHDVAFDRADRAERQHDVLLRGPIDRRGRQHRVGQQQFGVLLVHDRRQTSDGAAERGVADVPQQPTAAGHLAEQAFPADEPAVDGRTTPDQPVERPRHGGRDPVLRAPRWRPAGPRSVLRRNSLEPPARRTVLLYEHDDRGERHPLRDVLRHQRRIRVRPR